MEDLKKILIRAGLAVLILISLLLSFAIGQQRGKRDVLRGLKPQVDTLFIKDSSTFVEPQNEPKPRVITKEIPIPVYFKDSTSIDSLLNECARLERMGDSLQLILLREQKHYSDSTFDAWISGIDPKLDSIKTYHTNMFVTKTIPIEVTKPSRWGIGIQAGYGVSNAGLSPYIGVGVSYNLVYW